MKNNIPDQKVNISVRSDRENYYHYSAVFYRLVEAVACRERWHEMEAVIQVIKLDDSKCSIRFHLDLDGCTVPENIILGKEFELLHNNTWIEYKAENATGFTTPALVRNMILQDMTSSEPGLSITPVDIYIPLASTDYPLLSFRFNVKYIPVN